MQELCVENHKDIVLLSFSVVMVYKAMLLVQQHPDHSQQLLILALGMMCCNFRSHNARSVLYLTAYCFYPVGVLERLNICVAPTHAAIIEFLLEIFEALPHHGDLPAFQGKLQNIQEKCGFP